jgi:hypothetical protein
VVEGSPEDEPIYLDLADALELYAAMIAARSCRPAITFAIAAAWRARSSDLRPTRTTSRLISRCKRPHLLTASPRVSSGATIGGGAKR